MISIPARESGLVTGELIFTHIFVFQMRCSDVDNILSCDLSQYMGTDFGSVFVCTQLEIPIHHLSNVDM